MSPRASDRPHAASAIARPRLAAPRETARSTPDLGGAPRVSIIIVNWRARDVLLDCLAALLPPGTPADQRQVLVIDNASGDGSVETVARRYPAVRQIRNPDNRGFARAVNQGLALAAAPFALVLNPDVVIRPAAIAALLEFMEREPGVAAAGPCLRNPDGSLQGSARRRPSVWTGLFGRSACLTRWFPGNPVSRRELMAIDERVVQPRDVDWLSGACLMVRRRAWEQVGPMDERFFLFWEDADWCLRFRNAGWRVVYVPAASAIHRVGVSCAQRRLASTVDFHRSAYRLYRKHYLRAPLHPMIALLVPGLILSLLLRLPGALRPQR